MERRTTACTLAAAPAEGRPFKLGEPFVLTFVTATAGGALGWWIGSFVGFMTAYFSSVLGTAVGVYLGRRWTAECLS